MRKFYVNPNSGFLAFNGGSELAIVGNASHGKAVARSFMNTILGGSAGSVTAITVNYFVAHWQKGGIYLKMTARRVFHK